MTDSTREKIKQILSTMVEKNRYVFWYDEGGQEKEFATNINMPGISVLTTGCWTIRKKEFYFPPI